MIAIDEHLPALPRRARPRSSRRSARRGPNDTTFENIQARIRGNTLMAISNRRGHLLLTTGNKSEVAVGYCTLYGDMAGGLAVISDLPKTFVYEVAREYNRTRRQRVHPRERVRPRRRAPSCDRTRRTKTACRRTRCSTACSSVWSRTAASTEQVIAEGFDRDAGRAHRGDGAQQRVQAPADAAGVDRHAARRSGPGRRYPIAQRYKG